MLLDMLGLERVVSLLLYCPDKGLVYTLRIDKLGPPGGKQKRQKQYGSMKESDVCGL